MILLFPWIRLLHAPLHRYCADPLGWPSSFNANFLRSFVRRTSIPRSSRLASSPATMKRRKKKERRRGKGNGTRLPSLSFLPTLLREKEGSTRDFSTHLSSSSTSRVFFISACLRGKRFATLFPRDWIRFFLCLSVRGTRASGIFSKNVIDFQVQFVCLSVRLAGV